MDLRVFELVVAEEGILEIEKAYLDFGCVRRVAPCPRWSRLYQRFDVFVQADTGLSVIVCERLVGIHHEPASSLCRPVFQSLPITWLNMHANVARVDDFLLAFRLP